MNISGLCKNYSGSLYDTTGIHENISCMVNEKIEVILLQIYFTQTVIIYCVRWETYNKVWYINTVVNE